MRKIDELKSIVKEKAAHIKSLRNDSIEEKSKGNGPYSHSIRLKSLNDSWDFRHYHIAYCELRGRSRDEIEKPREDNLPNESKIKQIKELYAWSEEEIKEFNERKAKHEALCIGQN